MKTSRLAAAFCLTALFLFSCASAYAQITPSQDAFTNSASPATNYGANVLLDVNGNKQTSYIQFDLSSIPAGVSVTQATLKLYVNAVNKAGSFNVNYVNGAWEEGTITHNASPALGAAIVSNVSLTTADKNQYMLMDVTPALQAWLNGSQANDGIALVANSTFHASFDSKENTTTSHPPELDVVFSGGGTITGVLTGSSSGLTGGGTSGTLTLSLTTACASRQILQWNGSAWVCSNAGAGTITGVTAGTDLTGGGGSGNVTLNLDTTKVPQLNAANSFTGNMTVNGFIQAYDVSVTGQFSAQAVSVSDAYYVGSAPFAFGSNSLGNAFLGFAGNSGTPPTGGGNTGVGLDALSILQSGTGNVGIGALALSEDTTGSSNTACGANTMSTATTTSNNTATGYEALFSVANPNGNFNTADGAYALYSNVGGFQNTAMGYAALYANQAGGNTGVGIETVKNNQTGGDNTAIGAYALDNSDTASSGNTAAGAYALDGSSGSNLTCIGYECGAGSLAKTNATAIGAHAIVNQSNSIVLGGTGQYRVNVGIGTSTPTNILTIGRGSGHPVSDSWETYSSRRWKTNVETLSGALAKVEQLRGVSYDLKDTGKHEIGVIAEEVGAVVPEIVSYEANGKDASGVDYSRLTALLIEAVKEQRKEIAALQSQLRKRAKKQTLLESHLALLERELRQQNELLAARVAP